MSLISVQNNKSPRNDGLTKEFFVAFSDDIKDIFSNSCRTEDLKKELSTLQGKAILKLTEKKDKDIALASRPNLISPHQTAYVENRFIGESGRLIEDIIEITVIFNKEGFLVTMDIERAFDSLDHTFIISVLKKVIDFGNNFFSWIENLILK